MANIKLRYAVSCDQAIIADDGKISLVGIFERLYKPEDKAALNLPFYIVSSIAGDAGTYVHKVEVLSPSNKAAVSASYNSVIKEEGGVTTLLIRVSTASFSEIGKYKIRVQIGEEIISDDSVNFVVVEPKSA